MKELLPRQILGSRYRIICPLAEGGFGHTYIAEDTQRPGTPKCVVKRLEPASSDPKFLKDARRLFQSEAEILEKLGRQHSQIPLLLASFEEDQEFYLVQDFIEGHLLTDELKPAQRWTESQICQMLKDALSILSFVHKHQVIHRDIKPDNLIRRRQDKKLVLVDFGAVKQIRTQLTVQNQSSVTISIGTPGYMSTEQGHGKPRFNSDIYALGVISIQAATGLYPTQLQEDPETGEIIWRPWAQVSDGLANILTKMVHYHFKDRYKSAEEALQAVDILLKDHPDWDPDLQSASLLSESVSEDSIVQTSSKPPNPTAVSQGSPQPPNTPAPSKQTPVTPNPTVVSQGLPQQLNPQTPSEPKSVIPNPTVVSQGPPQQSNPLASSEPKSVAPNPTVVSQGSPQPPNAPASSEQTPVIPNPTVVSQRPPQQSNPQIETTPVALNPTTASQGVHRQPKIQAFSKLRSVVSKSTLALPNYRAMPLKKMTGAGALMLFISFAIKAPLRKEPEPLPDLPCQEPLPPSLPDRPPDYQHVDGTKYYGELDDGKFANGRGIMVFSNGDRYDGDFHDGQRNGCGTFNFSSKDKRYTGQFQNDHFHGLGKLIFKNGDQYIGELKNNNCHGQGTFIFADGSPAKHGFWQDGKLVKEGETFFCNR